MSAMKSLLSIDFITSEVVLFISCLCLDWPWPNQAISTIIRHHRPQYRAVEDNLSHGFLAAVSWFAVIGWRWDFWNSLLQICCCGMIGCAMDLDHFIQAKSFSLQVNYSYCSNRSVLTCPRIVVFRYTNRFYALDGLGLTNVVTATATVGYLYLQ